MGLSVRTSSVNPLAFTLGQMVFITSAGNAERCSLSGLETVFERSHVPLHKWLFTMYLMHIHRKGISSVQLAKEIGVTQKTAWFMLHRLREACGDDSTYLQMNGIVEVDETYLGGKYTNKERKPTMGRGAYGKQGRNGYSSAWRKSLHLSIT